MRNSPRVWGALLGPEINNTTTATKPSALHPSALQWRSRTDTACGDVASERQRRQRKDQIKWGRGNSSVCLNAERSWFSTSCYLCCCLHCTALHLYCWPSEFWVPGECASHFRSRALFLSHLKIVQVRGKKMEKMFIVICVVQQRVTVSVSVCRTD